MWGGTSSVRAAGPRDSWRKLPISRVDEKSGRSSSFEKNHPETRYTRREVEDDCRGTGVKGGSKLSRRGAKVLQSFSKARRELEARKWLCDNFRSVVV